MLRFSPGLLLIDYGSSKPGKNGSATNEGSTNEGKLRTIPSLCDGPVAKRITTNTVKTKARASAPAALFNLKERDDMAWGDGLRETQATACVERSSFVWNDCDEFQPRPA